MRLRIRNGGSAALLLLVLLRIGMVAILSGRWRTIRSAMASRIRRSSLVLLHKEVFPFKCFILRDASAAVLAEDYFYETRYEQHVVSIFLKQGFPFSSSVPRMFWRTIGCPILGRFAFASLIHDWLYVHKACYVNGTMTDVKRDFADKLFKHQMLADGVAPWRASIMYKAVSAFGSKAWRT